MTWLFAASSSVWPSGAERATASVAIVALAPPRFSITTGWPQAACSPGARARAMKSVGPPGGKPTKSRTGRSGQAAPAARQAEQSTAEERRCEVLLRDRSLAAFPALTKLVQVGHDNIPKQPVDRH